MFIIREMYKKVYKKVLVYKKWKVYEVAYKKSIEIAVVEE